MLSFPKLLNYTLFEFYLEYYMQQVSQPKSVKSFQIKTNHSTDFCERRCLMHAIILNDRGGVNSSSVMHACRMHIADANKDMT